MLTSGLGAAKYDFVTETGEDYLHGLHWDVHFRLYGGCNLDRFFYGFYFDSESNNNFLGQKIVLNNTSVSFLLTAGCRFGNKK